MKIAIAELIDIQSELSKELKNISAKLQIVKNKTNSISKLESFEGKAAAAAKAYFQAVHGKSVDDFEETINHLRKNNDKIISEFTSTVDSSAAAVITDDYLNELNKKVLTIKNDVLDTHEEGKQVIQSVSDIVPLTNPNISKFTTSVNTSQKYITEVGRKLSEFDKSALEIVNDSMKEIDKHHRKMNELTTVSIQNGASTDFVQLAEELGIEPNEQSSILSMADFFDSVKKGPLQLVKYLDKTDNIMGIAGQFYVVTKMTPTAYFNYVRTGKTKLKGAELRKLNNILATTLYRINDKTVIAHMKKYGKELFTKKRLIGLSNHLKPYGKGRRTFHLKEFDRLYGLDKYREFKKLSPLKKSGKMVTTFIDELVGKKYKGTKSALKSIVNWKNPKTAYKDSSKKTKESTDKKKVRTEKKNVLGRSSKITKNLGKGLGFLSLGIIVTDNYKTNKGDTKKIVVGTAVDSALTGGAAAIGATIGTAIVPPIGTVVGAVAGMAVGWIINEEFGTPPKSIADNTKDFANNTVDSALEASQKIGKSIAGWFK